MTEGVVELRRFGKCPICGKQAREANRPFCSPRCRDVDLGRWLDGTYAIESDERPEDDGDGGG